MCGCCGFLDDSDYAEKQELYRRLTRGEEPYIVLDGDKQDVMMF